MEKVTTKLEWGTVLEIDAGAHRIRIMYMTAGVSIEVYDYTLSRIEVDLIVR